MLLNRIRCYHYNKTFKLAFNSPQAKRRKADSVIVRVDGIAGRSGFGESAPRCYVTREDIHSVTHLIERHFAPVLFDASIDSLSAAKTLLIKLETICLENGIRNYQSALGAIDIAILDALEKSHCGILTQLLPPTNRPFLRFSASMPFLPLKIIKNYFPLLKSHVDIAVIKVLIDKDADANFERVKLIRELADQETELRLEFNGKLSFEEVFDNLKRLASFDISALEQPLPLQNLEKLQKLKNEFGVDLVADEALVDIEDAKVLAESGVYDIFNIKVSKCGGLLRSKHIAELANRHGILCQVGTHVGESVILAIAGRRLARSLPNFDCYGGGSEILFSQLFNHGRHATTATRPPTVENDIVMEKTLLELVSNYPLLADLRP